MPKAEVKGQKQQTRVNATTLGSVGNVTGTNNAAQHWSDRAREWAISEHIVDNEDYSSKHYAQESKKAANIATDAIDDIEANKEEFDASYNQKSQALSNQYTNYSTQLETKKTEVITDITNSTEDFTDLYNEYTENITTQKTQAIQDIATKETESITSIENKETEIITNITAIGTETTETINTTADGALEDIDSAKTEAISAATNAKNDLISTSNTVKEQTNAALVAAGEATIGLITTAKDNALAEINTADENALSDINTSLEAAKQEINNTKNDAIDDIINNAANEALERIEQIEADTTKTITDTKNEAVSTINTTVAMGQDEIEDAITDAKQELNTVILDADADLTNKIDAANTDLTNKVTSVKAEIDTAVTNAETNIETTTESAKSELNTIASTANTTIDEKVTNVTNIETHVTQLEASAEDNAELARKYAENPVDVPVIEGEYSAKHWANKSQEAATRAENVADTLENPMKNDLSNITEEGVEKIKEIAKVVEDEVIFTVASGPKDSNGNPNYLKCGYSMRAGYYLNVINSDYNIPSEYVFIDGSTISVDTYIEYTSDSTMNQPELSQSVNGMHVLLEKSLVTGELYDLYLRLAYVYYTGETKPTGYPQLRIDKDLKATFLQLSEMDFEEPVTNLIVLGKITDIEAGQIEIYSYGKNWFSDEKPSADIDLSNITEVAENKIKNLAALGAGNSDLAIKELYTNGNSGCIIWSNGYAFQWGRCKASTNYSDSSAVVFLREFKDTKYYADCCFIGETNTPITMARLTGNRSTTAMGAVAAHDNVFYPYEITWQAWGYLKEGEY